MYQLQTLPFEGRKRLVVRKEHEALRGITLGEALQPRILTAVKIVFLVRRVDAHQQPVVVDEREVAGLLLEPRISQDEIEVTLSTRIHLVVAVERAMHRVGAVRPEA